METNSGGEIANLGMRNHYCALSIKRNTMTDPLSTMSVFVTRTGAISVCNRL